MNTPTRHELAAKGTKVGVQLIETDFFELFKFKGNFYHTHNLDEQPSKVSPEVALLFYINPHCRDVHNAPSEIFPNLNEISNDWTDNKTVITFETKAGVIFKFTHLFDNNPTITIQRPDPNSTVHLCDHEDNARKQILYFNSTYFDYHKNQYHIIPEQKALEYYTSMRSFNHNLNPDAFFKLHKTDEKNIDNGIEKSFVTDKGLSFQVVQKNDKTGVKNVKNIPQNKRSQRL